MFPRLEPDCSWGTYLVALQALEADPPSLLLRLEDRESEPLAGEVLLGVILARDEAELRFLHSPELRLTAANALLDLRYTGGLEELARYLRNHWLYDGETEEVSNVIEKLHRLQLRPYRGFDGLELALAIEEALYGERSDPEAEIALDRLQTIRLVLWSTKDHVAFALPPDVRTLEDLAEESLTLGL